MREYREIPPPHSLREAVECCWISSHADAHRVLPDGCADILFRFREGQPELLTVGAMTRFEDVEEHPEESMVGIRFRPSMWTRVMDVRADEVTDQMLPLEDLWGAAARNLRERMANGRSGEERAAYLIQAVRAVEKRTAFQRAIGCLEMRRGMVSLDHLAREAGLSVRQFRRVCIRETGLSPKLLARILRFRHAEARASAESGGHAGLAADCGFADQAHMIAEFRRFAGRTPTYRDIEL